MNTPDNDRFDRIEDYLDEQLAAGERAAFDKQLAVDADLRKQLAAQQALRQDLAALALKQQLKQLHQQLDAAGRLRPEDVLVEKPEEVLGEKESSVSAAEPKRTGQWRWVAAASVALLLVAGLAYRWFSQPQPYAQLYDRYYSPSPVSRGAADCPANLTTAIDHYRAHRYTDALTALPSQADGCTNYYRGLTMLALQRPADARPALANARLSAPDLVMQQRATWYLALALVRLGDKDTAIPLLDSIAKTYGHPNQSQAKQLSIDLQIVSHE